MNVQWEAVAWLFIGFFVLLMVILAWQEVQQDKAEAKVKRLEEELYAYRNEDAHYHDADQEISHLFDDAERRFWERRRA